ncbi:hypothetical protein NVP1193O_182 [Vibrio phage 1.193.O._10N.286.52.C6]|nr:hypothetical protein NVP1193O_182 [Vibrio phage 1.193.O._10N.286.52.C6]
MAQIPNLQSTNTLGTDDQAILRQGTIDKRISLNLAGILSWATREGYSHIGEHTTGSQFPDTASFTTYQGRAYFVDEGVTLPYTSSSNDPSTDTNLYAKVTPDYKGLWPDTGGSANRGETWQTQTGGTPTGQYFTALQNTTVEPTSDDVNWREVISNESQNIGDQSITGSERFPPSVTQSAQDGQTVPIGISSIMISGSQYLLSGEIDGLNSPKLIDNINMTPPYSCTLDGVKNYLLKLPYYQKGRSVNDILALGAVGDFDDSTKTGTDNKEVFRAISRDLGGEWTGIGNFYTSTTTNYKKRTAWSAPSGMGAGVAFDFSIVTADGIPGHFYHYLDTDADDNGVPVVTTSTTASDGSVIGDGITLRNVTNTNKPTSVANAYGVWSKVRIKIGNANISNWQSNNVHIVATEISNDPLLRGNANSFHLDNPILWGSGADGLFCQGADVNAGIGSTVSAYRNVGYGINDSSFLGNYWPAINCGLNDSGGINFSNVNNRSIVINPYFELGSAGSEVTSSGRQGVIGGNVDDTSLSNTAFLYVDQSEWRANTTFASYEVVDGNNYRSRLGGAASDTLAFQVWESATVDASKWRMQWDSVSKSDFQLRYANIVSATTYKVTGENTTQSFARSSTQPYKMWFENELMVGSSARGAAIRKSAGVPPTSGLAGRGDTVFNNNPTAIGQPSGWNCITSGTNGIDAVYGVTSTIS